MTGLDFPDLAPGRVLCFLADPNRALGSLDLCRSVMAPEEIEKAMAFAREQDRHLSILARGLVRWLVSSYAAHPAKDLAIETDDFGKPGVRPSTPGAEISFNISHTRGLVACALALGDPVGVDVELLERRADPGIAHRFFTRDEAAWVHGVSGPDRHLRFLELWTLKEAYIKALGRGLAQSLDRMAFRPEQDWLAYHSEDRADQGAWQFFQIRPDPAILAALAVRTCQPVSLSCHRCIPFNRVGPAEELCFRKSPGQRGGQQIRAGIGPPTRRKHGTH